MGTKQFSQLIMSNPMAILRFIKLPVTGFMATLLFIQLTVSNSTGKSPPSLMPRFMLIKRSTVGLSFTAGL